MTTNQRMYQRGDHRNRVRLQAEGHVLCRAHTDDWADDHGRASEDRHQAGVDGGRRDLAAAKYLMDRALAYARPNWTGDMVCNTAKDADRQRVASSIIKSGALTRKKR